MKKIYLIITLFATVFFGGCIKNDPVLASDSKVEFDASTWNANAVGVTYPIIAGIPNMGFAGVPAGASGALTRATPTFRIRVNMTGSQKTTATNFSYGFVAAESTAIPGTHFGTLSGTGTIPANSSFGFIDIPVVNPGVSSPTPVVLVLELKATTDLPINFNYSKVGFRISQL